MTVNVDIRRVIDAIYAIDGVRGILADRRIIIGEELEAALQRLVPQAAAVLASRSAALSYRGSAGDILTFEVTGDGVTDEALETALTWTLLAMCRPDSDGAGSGSSGSGLPTQADGVLGSLDDALDGSAADCPARRYSHWLS